MGQLLIMLLTVSLSAGSLRGEEILSDLGRAAPVESGLVYGHGGGRDLRLDLYRPGAGEGPFPAVVFIHGGGWRGGQRGHFSRQALYLSANGYVCACIEYRLSGEALFPAALEDVKCAVRWLRAEGAGRFRADPERIAVSGGSAGGHLALLAATSGGEAGLEGAGGWPGYSSRVQCAVAFNPVCEPAEMLHEAVKTFLGGTAEEVPENYRRAAPATWLDKSDPPMLLLHGTGDQTVPYSQAADFVEKLKALGIAAGLYTEEGSGHGWFNSAPYFAPTTLALKEFLDEHLRK